MHGKEEKGIKRYPINRVIKMMKVEDDVDPDGAEHQLNILFLEQIY